MTLKGERQNVFNQFISGGIKYPEAKFPGVRTLLQATLEQGLAHVVFGSKPAYMGYHSVLADNQGDLSSALENIQQGRNLNENFSVVKYTADKLCTPYDATFVINKKAMFETISTNADALGIKKDPDSVNKLMASIFNGSSQVFTDEVKLGILLGFGEKNARTYVQRTQQLTQYESLPDDEYNEKVSALDASLGTSTTQNELAMKTYNEDITVPMPWLGRMWDSDETTKLAEDGLKESASFDLQARTLHGKRLTKDPDANYADTLVELMSNRLYR